MKKNYRLELIRGVAALAVLFTHLPYAAPYYKDRDLGSFINLFSTWGVEAVIVFFILSGIVIYLSYDKKRYSAGAFLKNRLLRLVPGAWIGIAIGLVAARLVDYHPSLATIAGNMLFTGTLNGFITPILITNGPLWSLSFEMAFYIFFIFFVIYWKNINAWLALSILCCPIYLFFSPPVARFSGVLAQLVWTMTYSIFFLTGIYVYRWRKKFQVPLSIGLLFLTLFMMPPRMYFAAESFVLFKFLGMTVVLLPLFLHCVSNPREITDGAVYKIGLLHFFIAYAVFATLFWLSNRSILSSALLYSFTPLCCFLLYFFRTPLLAIIDKARGPIDRVSKVLGKLSYGIYIFHYPLILIFASILPENMILLYLATIISVFPLAWLLEYKLQPAINKVFKGF